MSSKSITALLKKAKQWKMSSNWDIGDYWTQNNKGLGKTKLGGLRVIITIILSYGCNLLKRLSYFRIQKYPMFVELNF